MKHALVTGGSGDIGAVICAFLAKENNHVYVHANKNAKKAEAVVEQIQHDGGSAEAIVFDVTDEQACKQCLTELIQKKPIDILVNNAGITRDEPLVGMKKENWDAVINVSLSGFYNVTTPLLMPMIRQRKGGRIINISSVVGITGNRGQSNYAAAKAGLHGATKSLSQELASRNITVNAVAPGIIDAGMAKDIFDKDFIKLAVPMKRAGKAEEVAATVTFLASENASYITGQIISVNGGMA